MTGAGVGERGGARLESYGFHGAAMEPEANVKAWREALATMFDVADLALDEPEPFRADLETYAMGPLLLGRACSSGQRFSRTPEVIARSGVDHLIMQLYTKGGFAGSAGEMEVRVRAGDVCVFDLAQTLDTRATPFECVTVVVPRPMMEARLPQPEALHGLVLPRESALAGLLGRHLLALLEYAPRMTFDECQAVAEGTAALAVACLRGELERRDALVSGPAALTLIRIRQHIETRLGSSDLTADAVAAHFGMSRASLYRLFAPLGGVAEYIRGRRLHRAFFDLATPGSRGLRASEVARRWCLGTEASFTRAFKTAYGITPTAAREAALLGGPLRGTPHRADDPPALTRWMRDIAPPAANAKPLED